MCWWQLTLKFVTILPLSIDICRAASQIHVSYFYSSNNYVELKYLDAKVSLVYLTLKTQISSTSGLLEQDCSNTIVAHTNSDPCAQTDTEPPQRTNPTHTLLSKPDSFSWVIVHTNWIGGDQVVSKNEACLERIRRFAAVNYLAPLPRLQTSITDNTLLRYNFQVSTWNEEMRPACHVQHFFFAPCMTKETHIICVIWSFVLFH